MLRRWHALAPNERARRFGCAQQIVRRLVELPVPVIAAVHGAAVGAGLELALAADFCIAETDSSFRSGFVAVGLVPDFGGSWLLPRSIGAARAREMILANTRLDAATALAWGLLHRVVATGDAVASSVAMAHQFDRLPRAALAAAKRATHAAWDTTLADALDRSAYDQSRLMDEPEHRALVGG
jgi:2-(1,2-epoxy-1,2-dihydrophenyl)acetyl-CoA isomerase